MDILKIVLSLMTAFFLFSGTGIMILLDNGSSFAVWGYSLLGGIGLAWLLMWRKPKSNTEQTKEGKA